MRKAIVIAACATLVSAPPAIAGLLDQQAAVKDKERVVYKQRQNTGTRFARRACRSAEEWEQISESAKRNAAEAFNQKVIETRRD